MKLSARKLLATGAVLMIGGSMAGCGEAHPHPILERHHEEAVVEEACDFGRATAEESGANGLEFYERECE